METSRLAAGQQTGWLIPKDKACVRTRYIRPCQLQLISSSWQSTWRGNISTCPAVNKRGTEKGQTDMGYLVSPLCQRETQTLIFIRRKFRLNADKTDGRKDGQSFFMTTSSDQNRAVSVGYVISPSPIQMVFLSMTESTSQHWALRISQFKTISFSSLFQPFNALPS